MKKVSDYVREMLAEHEIARSALNEGFLNLSAFALKIKPQIEKRMLRHISLPSIVIALSRIKGASKRTHSNKDALVPAVIVKNISVQSGLSELAYEKTTRSMERARRIQHSDSMLLISYGVREITLITREEHTKSIRNTFAPQKPKTTMTELAAVTVTFDPKYLEVPNTIFALARTLALRRINVIEIVSTYSELTFVVRVKDIQSAFDALTILQNVRP